MICAYQTCAAGAKYRPPIAVVVSSRVASGSLTCSSFWAQASLAPKMAALVAALVAAPGDGAE